jgi:hypothetical protein
MAEHQASTHPLWRTSIFRPVLVVTSTELPLSVTGEYRDQRITSSAEQRLPDADASRHIGASALDCFGAPGGLAGSSGSQRIQ